MGAEQEVGSKEDVGKVEVEGKGEGGVKLMEEDCKGKEVECGVKEQEVGNKEDGVKSMEEDCKSEKQGEVKNEDGKVDCDDYKVEEKMSEEKGEETEGEVSNIGEEDGKVEVEVKDEDGVKSMEEDEKEAEAVDTDLNEHEESKNEGGSEKNQVDEENDCKDKDEVEEKKSEEKEEAEATMGKTYVKRSKKGKEDGQVSSKGEEDGKVEVEMKDEDRVKLMEEDEKAEAVGVELKEQEGTKNKNVKENNQVDEQNDSKENDEVNEKVNEEKEETGTVKGKPSTKYSRKGKTSKEKEDGIAEIEEKDENPKTMEEDDKARAVDHDMKEHEDVKVEEKINEEKEEAEAPISTKGKRSRKHSKKGQDDGKIAVMSDKEIKDEGGVNSIEEDLKDGAVDHDLKEQEESKHDDAKEKNQVGEHNDSMDKDEVVEKINEEKEEVEAQSTKGKRSRKRSRKGKEDGTKDGIAEIANKDENGVKSMENDAKDQAVDHDQKEEEESKHEDGEVEEKINVEKQEAGAQVSKTGKRSRKRSKKGQEYENNNGITETGKKDKNGVKVSEEDVKTEVVEAGAQVGTKGKKSRKDEGQAEKEMDEKEVGESTTPTAFQINRPVRERKSVERLVATIEKEPVRELRIEKGNGTALKDIPKVQYKLSRKKNEETLKTLHVILFGRRGKAMHVRSNVSQFSGFVWHENEEKQRLKIKERLDKCVKEKLLEFCDVLDIGVVKTTIKSIKKEDIVTKLLDFLAAPRSEKESGTTRKRKRVETSMEESGRLTAKRSSAKQIKTEGSPNVVEKENESESDDEFEKEEDDERLNTVPDGSDDEVAEHSESEVKGSESGEDSEEETRNQNSGSKGLSGKTTSSAKDKSKKVTTEKKETPVRSPKKVPIMNSSKVNDSIGESPVVFSRRKKSQETTNKKSFAPSECTSKENESKKSAKGKDKVKEACAPTDEELRKVIYKILREADLKKATFLDILEQLGKHFKMDLTSRKLEIKPIVKDELMKFDEEDEDDESDTEKEEELEPAGSEEST